MCRGIFQVSSPVHTHCWLHIWAPYGYPQLGLRHILTENNSIVVVLILKGMQEAVLARCDFAILHLPCCSQILGRFCIVLIHDSAYEDLYVSRSNWFFFLTNNDAFDFLTPSSTSGATITDVVIRDVGRFFTVRVRSEFPICNQRLAPHIHRAPKSAKPLRSQNGELRGSFLARIVFRSHNGISGMGTRSVLLC